MFKLWAILLTAVGIAGNSLAWGQTGSSWDRVKAIDAGTQIRLSLSGNARAVCAFVDASDSQVACSHLQAVFFVPRTRRLIFARDQVIEVRLAKPLLSGVCGAAIGLGAGVGTGFALQNQATRAEDPGLLPVTLGIFGGMLGGVIGHKTDFISGPVVYRAP